MQAQRLRHRVTVQQKDPTPDAYGQPSLAWMDVATLWADIQPVTGKEIFSAQAGQNPVSVRIVLRARSGLLPSMRVVHGSTQYSIEAVLPVSEREVQLLCSTGVSDG